MKNVTIALGAGLIALGVIAYFATGRDSLTALLPAVLGVPILVLGVLAMRENMRRHAIHAALVLALLGALGTMPQVVQLPDLLMDNDVERPAAVVTSTITAVACLLYVVLGVRSFVAARRERRTANAG
jgi:uncharacterized membrane protein